MEFQDVIEKVFNDSKPPNSVQLEFINDDMTMRIFEALPVVLQLEV